MGTMHEKALERIGQLQERGEKAQAARLKRLLAQADETLEDFEKWEGKAARG